MSKTSRLRKANVVHVWTENMNYYCWCSDSLSHRVSKKDRDAGLWRVTNGGEVMTALKRHNNAPTRQTHKQLRKLSEACWHTPFTLKTHSSIKPFIEIYLEFRHGWKTYVSPITMVTSLILTLGGNTVSSQRRLMTLHCVKACRHQNHIWTELLCDGHHHTPTHTNTQRTF